MATGKLLGAHDDRLTAQPILRVDGLHKTYRSWRRRPGFVPQRHRVDALSGMSFSVSAGEIVGLLGPNGSGKTTAMKIVLGLARADHGQCDALGERLPGGARHVVPQIGALIETPRFYPHFTARQTLRLLARIRGVPEDRVDAILDDVGLAEAKTRHVGGFSLGMRQRLALAGSLLKRPRLLLLDEPANGLDPSGIHQLRLTLQQFASDGGTVLVSSHAIAEIEQLADRVVVVARGRTIADGTLPELLGTDRTAWRLRVQEPEPDVATVLVGHHYEVRVDNGAFLVTGEPPVHVASRALTDAGLTITELVELRPSLEERYLQLVDEARGAGSGWGT